jgi:predicted PurR-regulated permease PerM
MENYKHTWIGKESLSRLHSCVGASGCLPISEGAIVNGIILVVVGITIISSVDNILRPFLIRGKVQMPTLAIFFSILG